MKGCVVKAVLVILGLILMGAGCAPEKPKTPGEREVANFEIYSTGGAGTPPYQESLALAQMLSELHPWLKASILETLGGVDAKHTCDALPPERRKYSAPLVDTNIFLTKSWLGEPPHKRKLTDLKWGGYMGQNAFTFGTYNPKIRTPQDLIGKTVAVYATGSSMRFLSDAVLMDAWGIYDQVRLSAHRPMDFKDVLITGVADAYWSVGVFEGPGGKFLVNPFNLEVIGAKQTYWIDISEEDIVRINQKNPWKTWRVLIPKGSLGGNNPPEDVGTMAFWNGFVFWEDTPEEIVYEVIKFLSENAEEWSKRANRPAPTAQSLASFPPEVTENMIHPGALRFFKEHNLKIGR